MQKKHVICIGEALVDRIKNKSNEGFKDFLGGAPANVASALKKLQIDSVFIGRLGSDKFGEKFIKYFDELAVNINFLQLDNNLPTRIVKVNRDKYGDRYFSGFDPASQNIFADEALSKDLSEEDLHGLEKLFLETKYLVSGTILLSSSISAESIYFFLDMAAKFNVKIIIDVNWREVFWERSAFSLDKNEKQRLNLIKNFLNHAHILKLAKEEAILFFEKDNPLEISKRHINQPDVIITDGGNPIRWYINGFEGVTDISYSNNIIDTTGAGDAFLAGLITQLISYDLPLKKIEIEKSINFASVCGFLNCLGEGAIEHQPDYKKIEEFLGSSIL